MKVIVIGSGVIGLTTAYFLGRRGHEVTVIDRQDGPGRETSFANGALLTPSMAEPWNAPGCWKVLLASFGRSDAALQLHARALPSLVGWGVTFLRNSRAAAFERNALNNLRLALYSLDVMQTLRHETGIEYGRAVRGTLRLFRHSVAWDRAAATAGRRVCEGLNFRRLSATETIEFEPALAPMSHDLAGAIHYEADEIGDAYSFCVALTDNARRLGVEFRFRAEVSSFEVRSGRITAVVTHDDCLKADQYLVAAGSESAPLLRRIGVDLPVRPAKGYSVTFDTRHAPNLLRIPIVDDDAHAAIVPLEGALRVVGTAEFAGFDRTLPPARIKNHLMLLQNVLPQARIDPSSAKSWCGLRPMSADGVPIIGPTPLSNLLVNTGHGHLGWTMAAGSAQLLVDLMSGDSPSIDPAPYNLKRFA
jgi:D-amino-acid dehydrogenase